jgi:hypothetical protein
VPDRTALDAQALEVLRRGDTVESLTFHSGQGDEYDALQLTVYKRALQSALDKI